MSANEGDAEPAEWRPVVGYEGLYEVSNLGQVRNLRTGSVYRGGPHIKGYPQVHLLKDAKKCQCCVHVLVAEAFLGTRRSRAYVVNHKDGRKWNNALSNLEYRTHGGNVAHAVATGLRRPKPGIKDSVLRSFRLTKEVYALLESVIEERQSLRTWIVDTVLREHFGLPSLPQSPSEKPQIRNLAGNRPPTLG